MDNDVFPSRESWTNSSIALFALLLATTCASETSQLGNASEGPLPRVSASQDFWDRWSDGKGEVSAYRLVTPRYGQLREGVAVLIYVLEQSDRRTWIKDDRGAVPEEFQTVVMKLNETMSFRTGIYPYSVMTSVFSPVNGIGRERFAPTRIVLTSQEWCGQVYHRIMPRAESFSDRCDFPIGSSTMWVMSDS